MYEKVHWLLWIKFTSHYFLLVSYNPWHCIKTWFSLHTNFKFQISWVPFISLDVTGDTACVPVNIYCFSTGGYSFSKLTSIFCLGFISTKFIFIHINSNLLIVTIPPFSFPSDFAPFLSLHFATWILRCINIYLKFLIRWPHCS